MSTNKEALVDYLLFPHDRIWSSFNQPLVAKCFYQDLKSRWAEKDLNDAMKAMIGIKKRLNAHGKKFEFEEFKVELLAKLQPPKSLILSCSLKEFRETGTYSVSEYIDDLDASDWDWIMDRSLLSRI